MKRFSSASAALGLLLAATMTTAMDGGPERARAALVAAEATLDGPGFERALVELERTPGARGRAYLEARAHLGLVSVHQRGGDAAAALAHAEAAVASAKTATEHEPRLSDAHRVLGEALGRLIALKGGLSGVLHGRRSHNALALALRLDPLNVKAHVAFGVSKLRTPRIFGGDPDEAIRAFERAVGLAPDAWEPHVWLGIARRERGDLSGARAALERAAGLSPRNAWVSAELATVPPR